MNTPPLVPPSKAGHGVLKLVPGGAEVAGHFVPEALLDFRNVLYMAWQILGLPHPTKLQYDIANALQNIVKPRLGLPVDPRFAVDYPHLCGEDGRPSPRLVLEAFRGIGKSWITGVLVVWCLLLCPTLNIMVVSASKKKSDGFSTFAKRLISEVPEFRHMEADVHRGQRWSTVAFDVRDARAADQDASVYSVSVMGAMTGGRGDVIIGDDVEVPNTSETQGMRDKLEERTKELEAIVKPEGIVILLGTPQTEETLYDKRVRGGYVKGIWPARLPGSRWMLHNGDFLAKVVKDRLLESPELTTGFGMDGTLGAPADPERFDDEDLIRREAIYGRSGFALQFMLDTSLSDADRYPLKLKDLTVMDFDEHGIQGRPVWAAGKSTMDTELPCVGLSGDRWVRAVDFMEDSGNFGGTILAVDPSGRGKDELSYAVISHLKGYLYVHEVAGVRMDGYSPEALALLAGKAKQYGVSATVVESNFGDGMFTELLKPVMRRVWPNPIEEVRHSRQKELRIIDTLEPVMNQHRLVVHSRVIWQDIKPHEGESQERGLHRQLFHQLTRITKERGCLRFDDRLDVLAIGVAHWLKGMAIDADEVDFKRAEKARVDRLKERLKHGPARVISTRDHPKPLPREARLDRMKERAKGRRPRSGGAGGSIYGI
jgi:hypothetical protein